MKTTQAKKSKIKVLKAAAQQTKAKLPQYKRRNKVVQGKRKSFLKCLTMNSPSVRTQNIQGSLLSTDSTDNEQLASQSSSKRKKKKAPTTIKGTSDKPRHSVDLPLESGDDSTGAWSPRGDKRCHVSKQQRNVGSPVIVEALSETLSSLSIPEALRHTQKFRTEKDTVVHNLLYRKNTKSKKVEACVVIAESINPNDTSFSGGNETRIASSSKGTRKERKDRKSLQNKDPSVSNSTWDSREQTTTNEEWFGDIKLGTVGKIDSVLETETASYTYRGSMNNAEDVRDPVRFYCLRNKAVVVMSEKSRFCFTGKLVMRVVYGAVEAYGHVVTAESEPVEIYSPRGYSSVSIATSYKYSPNNESDIWVTLRAEGVSRDTRNELVADIDKIQPGAAVILLSNLENKLTRFLNVYYPFKLFPKICNSSYLSWTDPKRAEAILQSNLYVGNYACKELIIDPRVAQDVSENMLDRWRAGNWCCTLIAGGKSVGKSTAARYLINSLLPVSKMVVLVDVDLGQAECTPQGCISINLIEQPLMGPNFTHLKTPVFQLYIGDVNVTRCITRYIEGMKILADRLSSCPMLSRLPIVVNTMGFTYGIGWDIAVFTIKLTRPSLVVQIMSEKPKNNYASYLSKQVVNQQKLPWASWSRNIVDWRQLCNHELCLLRSCAERKSAPVNDTWNMEPYQQRELVLISYLSEIAKRPESSTPCYGSTSFSINEAVPYATSFSSLTVSIPRASVPSSHVLNVVNGNIVALCGIDLEDGESRGAETISGLRVLDRSPLCSCYGFGIVRGVDTEREEVFINTPLPASMMQYVNCLVGCIPVPITLLQLNQQKPVPYAGGNNVLPTSREPRRGYFRMRYEKGQNNS